MDLTVGGEVGHLSLQLAHELAQIVNIGRRVCEPLAQAGHRVLENTSAGTGGSTCAAGGADLALCISLLAGTACADEEGTRAGRQPRPRHRPTTPSAS